MRHAHADEASSHDTNTHSTQPQTPMKHATTSLERTFAFGDTVVNAKGFLGKVGGTNYENGTLLVTWLRNDEAEIIPMSSVALKTKASATKGVFSSLGSRFAS